MIAYSFIIGGHDAPVNSDIIAFLLTDTLASKRPSAEEGFINHDVLNLRYFHDWQIAILVEADPDTIVNVGKEIRIPEKNLADRNKDGNGKIPRRRSIPEERQGVLQEAGILHRGPLGQLSTISGKYFRDGKYSVFIRRSSVRILHS